MEGWADTGEIPALHPGQEKQRVRWRAVVRLVMSCHSLALENTITDTKLCNKGGILLPVSSQPPLTALNSHEFFIIKFFTLLTISPFIYY